MEKRYGYIYIHIFPNNKYYIGQTAVNPKHRWGYNGKGYDNQPLMKKAIKKYGWENIKHEVLEEGLWTLDEINAKEQYWINFYNSHGTKGYNLTPGGRIPAWGTRQVYQLDRSDYHIINLFNSITEAAEAVRGSSECIVQCCNRSIQTANNYCWCYKDEYYQGWKPKQNKIRKRPRVYCLETDTVYDSPQEVEIILGVNHLKVSEVCRKVSNSAKGYHFCYIQNKKTFIPLTNKSCSPIICIETGEEFESIAQASRKFKINYTSLKRCLSKRQLTAGGYHWKYKKGPRKKDGKAK